MHGGVGGGGRKADPYPDCALPAATDAHVFSSRDLLPHLIAGDVTRRLAIPVTVRDC
jgi:hypothetical protein